MINKFRCWIGKHTYPLYANKFISVDPWWPDEGGYGYRAQCFICDKVKEEWIYDTINDYMMPPNQRAKMMHEEFEKLNELKLTDEMILKGLDE